MILNIQVMRGGKKSRDVRERLNGGTRNDW